MLCVLIRIASARRNRFSEAILLSKHNIPFSIKKRKPPLIILNLWDYPRGLKNEFETTVVNEPSVFEPLKVNCIMAAVKK